MLVARAHKIEVSVVFVLLAAWLLVGSLLAPPNQRAIESGSYGTQESGRKIAMPNSAEDRIADYTWWLSAFTLALVVVSAVQIRFLIRADKTARIAAEAAVKSASAATAIEFPIVRTSWIGPEVTSTDELVRPHVPYAGAVNYGWPTRFSAISEIEFKRVDVNQILLSKGETTTPLKPILVSNLPTIKLRRSRNPLRSCGFTIC
jgi:hypothetical protein